MNGESGNHVRRFDFSHAFLGPSYTFTSLPGVFHCNGRFSGSLALCLSVLLSLSLSMHTVGASHWNLFWSVYHPLLKSYFLVIRVE